LRRSRLLLAGLTLAFAQCFLARCFASPEFSSDTHNWGTYSVCAVRASDTCHPAGEACTSAAVSPLTMPIGVTLVGNTFRLARDPLPPLAGTQVGTHFEVTQQVTTKSGIQQAFCGCPVDVTETIRGELLSTAPVAPSCDASDGGAPGCVDDGGLSPYDSSTGWLSGDGGIELILHYPAIQGRIVDTVQVAAGVAVPDGGCSCLPCSIEYDFSGTQ
jgi:hypothetical protein